MGRLVPMALLFLVSASSVAAKDWRGILPLHSTREDVEALLGPPPQPPENRSYTLNKGRSIYFLDEGEVYIIFADGQLLTSGHCPSVAAGTVMMIRVTPKDEVSLKNLNLDEKTFTKFDPSQTPGLGFEAFIDKQDGLVILARNGKVEELVYFANASDQARCSGYYDHPEEFVRVGFACGLPFDQYGNIRFSDEKARLDNFAIQLQNEEKAQGHIIVYAGRKATVAEAQLRANRARDYLIQVRDINPERIKAVDGGYREELTVILYVAPPGAAAPAVEPTVDPSQVEMIYEKKRRPQRKRPG